MPGLGLGAHGLALALVLKRIGLLLSWCLQQLSVNFLRKTIRQPAAGVCTWVVRVSMYVVPACVSASVLVAKYLGNYRRQRVVYYWEPTAV